MKYYSLLCIYNIVVIHNITILDVLLKKKHIDIDYHRKIEASAVVIVQPIEISGEKLSQYFYKASYCGSILDLL